MNPRILRPLSLVGRPEQPWSFIPIHHVGNCNRRLSVEQETLVVVWTERITRSMERN
jgi:hypothetical protein